MKVEEYIGRIVDFKYNSSTFGKGVFRGVVTNIEMNTFYYPLVSIFCPVLKVIVEIPFKAIIEIHNELIL